MRRYERRTLVVQRQRIALISHSLAQEKQLVLGRCGRYFCLRHAERDGERHNAVDPRRRPALVQLAIAGGIAHDDRVPRAHLEHRIVAVPDSAIEQFGFERVECGSISLKPCPTSFSGNSRPSRASSARMTDTNMLQVKKIVMQIGEELSADPDYAPDLIQSLKSAGVMAAEDSAIVVRVKFTARPTNNSWVVRRIAYDKIIRAFRAAGIRFAHRQVTVNVPAPAAASEVALSGAAAVESAIHHPDPR